MKSKNLIFYFFILISFVSLSCKDDTVIQTNTTEQEIIEFTPGDSTTYPSKEGNLVNYNVDSTSVSLTYSSNPPQFQVGHFIVDTMGQGLCRRISSVQVSGNTVNMTTSNARFNQAFKNAHVKKTIQIKPTGNLINKMQQMSRPIDTTYSVYSEGKQYKIIATSNKPSIQGNNYMNGNSLDFTWMWTGLEIKIYDPSNTLALSITADTLLFAMSLNFQTEIIVNNWNVTYLKLVKVADQNVTLKRTNVQGNISINYSIAKIRVFDIIIPPPIPVGWLVFTVGFGVDIGADATVNISTPIGTDIIGSGNYHVEAGAEWVNGGFNPIFNNNSNLTSEIKNSSTNGSLTVTVMPYIQPFADLSLYGIIGPQFYVQAGFPITLSGPPPQCRIDAKLSCGVDLDLSLFGLPGFNIDRELYRINGPNSCGIIGPSGWYQVNSGTSINLSSVTFTSPNIGFTCGNTSSNGIIFKTTNNGINWINKYTYATNNPTTPGGVMFPNNSNIGYVSDPQVETSPCYIYKTNNNGENWSPIEVITPPLAIFFTDINTGYSGGGSSLSPWIIKTTNGGNSWNNSLPHELFYCGAVSSLFFSSNNIGYGGCFSGYVLKTNNMGNSWNLLNTSLSNRINSIFFIDDNIGFFVGHNGLISKTTDGGNSFFNISSGTSNNLRSIKFINSIIGYLVGDGGIIMKTSNGGSIWINQSSGSNNNLNSVYFINSSTGYTVGDGGIILKTTTGGQ